MKTRSGHLLFLRTFLTIWIVAFAWVAGVRAQVLIDVDFGAGNVGGEVGFAATGQTTNDFWNFYTRDDGQGGYLTLGSLTNLKYADGSASTVGLIVGNAPGAWANSSSDEMFHSYIYPFSGNASLTVTNLPSGSYDFYIYGSDGIYQAAVAGTNYGPKTAPNAAVVNPIVWQENVQYVVFWGVAVAAGQTASFTVGPGPGGYALMSGMQIATASAPPSNLPPVIVSQPSSQSVAPGSNATFTVSADGTAPFTYQWFFSGNALGGSTDSTLALSNVQSTNAGGYKVVVANAYGSITSSVATLTVTQLLPLITTQPQSRTNGVGSSALFTVAAIGAPSLRYQWFFNGSNLSGAISPSLSLGNVQPANAGNYSVRVTNIYGAITSSVATLTVVGIAPAITGQPAGRTVAPGSNVTFTVAATGSSPLKYQWRYNGGAVSGATTSFFTLNNVQPVQSGDYSVIVSNAFGVATSTNAVLTVQAVNQAPVANAQSVAVARNGSVPITLSASDVENEPLTYQLVALPSHGVLTGTAPVLTYQPATNYSGPDTFTFTANDGRVDSASAVVSILVLGDGTQPLIDVQFCALGNPGGLKDRKTGPAAIGQLTNDFWNAYSRDGADGSFLSYGSLSNLQMVDGGATASGLTVANAPGAWSNGSSDPMYATFLYPFNGGNITVTVTNLNAGTYDFYLYGHEGADTGNGRYQLSVDGQSYGTHSDLSGPGWNTTAWQEGVQYVRFTNVAVSVDQVVTITVLPGDDGLAVLSGLQMAQLVAAAPVAPVITGQPADKTVVAGSSASFSVGVSGSHPLSYQWHYGGSDIVGATSGTLTLVGVQAADAGNYSVTVTNAVGSATSSNAVLTVTPVIVQTNDFGTLIDVQFCALANPGGLKDRKTGLAAIGQTGNDYWNAYSRDGAGGSFLTFGSLSNLKLVDGSVTAAGLTVANAPGAWSNGSLDPMYATYLYPFNGGSITVTVTNLNAGSYELYLYGHAPGNNGNSTYQVSVSGQVYGSLTTADAPGWDSLVWQEGVQYVRFTNVVVSPGQVVTLTVLPGDSGYAILSGLQIKEVTASAPVAPIIVQQPADHSAVAGTSVSFGVSVTGSYPLSYQWQHDGSDIAGATVGTLTLTGVQLSDAGNYSVAVTNAAGSATSSNAVLTVTPVVVQTNGFGTLIDVQFCALANPGGLKDRKSGLAAAGQTTNDFWNAYSRDGAAGGFLSYGVLTNLQRTDGTVTAAGLSVANAPGAWSNGSSDPMYATFLYPFDGGNITVTVTNLEPGAYDFYLYGHEGADTGNGRYQLSVDGQSYGTRADLSGSGWNTVAWQEGVQYVRFTNVVVSPGQVVTITALPGDNNLAVLSGLQMAQGDSSVPLAFNQSVALVENTSIAVTLTGSDPGGQAVYSVLSQPLHGTLSGSAPNLTFQPAANYSGPDSFTFQVTDGQLISATATVSIVVLPESSGPLIDVAFGAGAATGKVGFAAAGQVTNDFWNFYTRDDGFGGWRTFGGLANLKFVNGIQSGAGLTIANAPGAWGNGASDPMYQTYIYPFDGGNITVTLTNLIAGSYNFYIYGHAGATNGNSTYQMSVGGQSYGSHTTAGLGWDSLVWQDGVQYVKFTNVTITAGQVATIMVLPGASGYAVLSGLQMELVLPPAPPGPPAPPRPAGRQALLFNASSTTGQAGSAMPPPTLSMAKTAAGGFRLSFAGVIGRSYRIEAADNPNSGPWTPLATVNLTQSPYAYTDADATTKSSRFYRVVPVSP
jgi:hypothetical protein